MLEAQRQVVSMAVILRSIGVGLLLLVPTITLAVTPFVHETVDGPQDTGLFNSIAVEADGTIHISYHEDTYDDLKYAVRTADGWTIETVDADGVVGYETSIVLDAAGHPHISYYRSGDSVRYATKSAGSWTIEAIETGIACRGTSIGLDSAGDPHVVYVDATAGALDHATRTDGVWSIETIDDSGEVHDDTSLEITADGILHVSYQGGVDGDLMYGTKVGSIWTLEAVAIVNEVGSHSSLELDSGGHPHMVYYDETNGDLRYVHSSGGDWTFELVDALGDVGLYASLALDAADVPHVSYHDATRGDLRYAKREGGTWSVESVDTPGLTGGWTSIALDAEGNPLIAHHREFTSRALRLADSTIRLTSPVGGERWNTDSSATITWRGVGEVDIQLSLDGGASYVALATGVTGGEAVVHLPGMESDHALVKVVRETPHSSSVSGSFTIAKARIAPWWTSFAVTEGSAGRYSSLALSAGGQPHVSYYDASTFSLRYAIEDGADWLVEDADDSLGTGSHSSLALDVHGDAHVSYTDLLNTALKYATRVDGIWSTTFVDSAGDVGAYTSLALDDEDRPHISYHDATNGALRYATMDGVWVTETVDSDGTVGEYTSIAVDDQGYPHVSYYDAGNGHLKYATRDGAWSVETVDSLAVTGQHTSIALDDRNDPHISYYALTGGNLEYAVKRDGVWHIETVDASENVGDYTSIAIDSRGRPHISYYDEVGYDLLHAVKDGTVWRIDVVDSRGFAGPYSSLALDELDNPHVSYFDPTDGDLKYASGGLAVTGPAGGVTWPVGGPRAITWDGIGVVDISISVDGGGTYVPVASGASRGTYPLLVPHIPTRFGRVRVERREEANDHGTYVYLAAISESELFTIDASVALLSFRVDALEDDTGVVVAWRTEPGVPDLAGYRLERRRGGGYVTVVSHSTDTTHRDPEGTMESVYRLFAEGGFGDELYLGSTDDGATPPPRGGLSVHPVPLRSGTLTVEFATTLGGPDGATTVAIYDILGRRVRTLGEGIFPHPQHVVTWDGTRENGTPASSGVYIVEARTPIGRVARKFTLIR